MRPGSFTGSRVVLQLGVQLRAVVAGADVGAAPNESVAVLALLLAEGNGTELPRKSLAAQIYPDSAQAAGLTALRQSVARLKRWLGEDALKVSVGNLVASDWRLESVNVAGVASAYRHPAFIPYRDDSSPLGATGVPILERFAATIREVAEVDPDSARAMLVTAPSLANSLTPEQALSLLQFTRPRSRSDSMAFEHCEMQAWILIHKLAIPEGLERMRRGLRIARHAGRSNQANRALAFMLFAALETGDMGMANQILETIQGEFGRHRLLLDNALIAHCWNSGQAAEALELVKRRIGPVRGESRHDQLHFWTNAAVLASEVGDREFLAHALESAVPLFVTDLDRERRTVFRLAELQGLSAIDPWQAVKDLQEVSATAAAEGRLMLEIYAREAEAVAHARLGDLSRAAAVWRACEQSRTGRGWRLNPRLLALRRVVQGVEA